MFTVQRITEGQLMIDCNDHWFKIHSKAERIINIYECIGESVYLATPFSYWLAFKSVSLWNGQCLNVWLTTQPNVSRPIRYGFLWKKWVNNMICAVFLIRMESVRVISGVCLAICMSINCHKDCKCSSFCDLWLYNN